MQVHIGSVNCLHCKILVVMVVSLVYIRASHRHINMDDQVSHMHDMYKDD